MKDTDALRNMKYTLEKLDEIWVNPLLKQPQKFSDSRVFISMNQNLFDVNRVEKSNDGVFRELT